MKNRNIIHLGLFTVSIAFLMIGCNSQKAHPKYTKRGPIEIEKTYSGSYPIKVVCTTGMVGDLARNVGGAKVQVTTLMGAGVDPHLFKPSESDINAINDADLVFYSGLHLEGKMTDIFESLSRKKPVFAVAEYFEPSEILISDDGVDPHVWFDVELWNKARGIVADALSKFDPKHKDKYHQRSKDFGERLIKLHKKVVTKINELPKSKRILVTAHDAFGYFGKKYGFRVEGIQGISTADEAGVKRIDELIDLIVRNKIKAVFAETSVNDRNMDALIEGCKKKNWDVSKGDKNQGKLYSDAMGRKGSPGATYEGMIWHNATTIVNALKDK